MDYLVSSNDSTMIHYVNQENYMANIKIYLCTYKNNTHFLHMK